MSVPSNPYSDLMWENLEAADAAINESGMWGAAWLAANAQRATAHAILASVYERLDERARRIGNVAPRPGA